MQCRTAAAEDDLFGFSLTASLVQQRGPQGNKSNKCSVLLLLPRAAARDGSDFEEVTGSIARENPDPSSPTR